MKAALGLTADGAWRPFRLGRLNVRNGLRAAVFAKDIIAFR
jgi:hypothetical protein